MFFLNSHNFCFDEGDDHLSVSLRIVLCPDAAPPCIGRLTYIPDNLSAEQEWEVVHGGIEQLMAFLIREFHFANRTGLEGG